MATTPPNHKEDKFQLLVEKWQKQSRESIAEANREKLDFLNNIDQYESFSQMKEETQQLATKQWNELPFRKKLTQIANQFFS